jgi:hypothetical protein
MFRNHAPRLRAFGVALLLVASTSGSLAAAPKPKPGAAPPPGADKDKPFQEWSKVTKDSEKLSGFFTLYRKRDNLYLEIRPEQLQKPFLGVFSLGSGLGSNFVLGGMPVSIYTGRDDHVLEFQREGDYVLVLEKNMRFVSPAGSPYE